MKAIRWQGLLDPKPPAVAERARLIRAALAHAAKTGEMAFTAQGNALVLAVPSHANQTVEIYDTQILRAVADHPARVAPGVVTAAADLLSADSSCVCDERCSCRDAAFGALRGALARAGVLP